MKLQTLINIATSANSKKIYTLTYKDKEHLIKLVGDILVSFEDSDEPLSPVESVVEKIFRKSGHNTPSREVIEETEKSLQNTTDSTRRDIFEKIILRQKSLLDHLYVELTKDEMYEIFSLSSWRESQLNKII